MTQMLGALIRQQREAVKAAAAAKIEAERFPTGTALVTREVKPRFPAYIAGQSFAPEPVRTQGQSLPVVQAVNNVVPYESPTVLEGEPDAPAGNKAGESESVQHADETPQPEIHVHVHVHEIKPVRSIAGQVANRRLNSALRTLLKGTQYATPEPRIEQVDAIEQATSGQLAHVERVGIPDRAASEDAGAGDSGAEYDAGGTGTDLVVAESEPSVYPDYGDYETESYDSGDSDSLDSAIAGGVDILSAPSIIAGINFRLDPSQEAAIIGLAREQRGCLIGAAGTGKTTTTKMLVHTLMYGNAAWGLEPLRLKAVDIKKYHERASEAKKKAGKKVEEVENVVIPSIAMVAFTGQATQVLKKNMPKEWARNVMTIHLLLGFAPVTYDRADGSEGIRFEPSYTKFNKMPWDVIIVDETSMVAVDLWHQLLDAAKPGCRFYFIGDLNQLPPPIGAGILGFALSKWPVFELTVVHRQADDTANRIVDTAHRILNGLEPVFDDTRSPDWRVAGMEIKHSSDIAHQQIIRIADQLSKLKYPNEATPVYDPWRDRIMVPMNGHNPDRPNYMLGQVELNESLALLFAGEGNERYIINAKKKIQKFAIGYRVMATKNEAPNIEDRVTNGLTGKITAIEENEKWAGERRLVGLESQVKKNRLEMMKEVNRHEAMTSEEKVDELGNAIDSFRLSALSPAKADAKDEESEKQGGPASHFVTVAFDNGATRRYGLNAQIEQLQIAYASTVHKAQGAEMPLAIVVIHHNQKMMLNRELFYTAVTRASQRVLILYTPHGMRIALKSQRISGSTLPEKIKQYQELLGESGSGFSFKTMNVRLFQDEESLPGMDAGYDEGGDDPADQD